MYTRTFYTGGEIQKRYDEIIPAYQNAFAGPPWFEVTKCADTRQRCVGGFSSLAVGECCEVCTLSVGEVAYPAAELRERFDLINETKDTCWYTEDTAVGLTLAAVAWRATAAVVAREKYADVPEMLPWMVQRFGEAEIIWLDEIFANKQIQSTRNLQNFGSLIVGFSERLGPEKVAYRTITEQMVRVAERDFATAPFPAVPDRRSFIVLDIGATA